MKKILILTVLCFFLVFSLSAEEKSVYEEFDQALGGFGGEISGWGLSYQQWFDKVGFETAGGFYYDGGSTFTYVLGAQAQFMLYEDFYSDWFTGCLYFFTGGKHGGDVTASSYEPGIGIGAGVGVELVLFQHFSLPLEFGYGGVWKLSSIIPVSAGPQIQGGFRYRY